MEDTTVFLRMSKIFEQWMLELQFLVTVLLPFCWDEDGDPDFWDCCCTCKQIDTPAWNEGSAIDTAYLYFGYAISLVW